MFSTTHNNSIVEYGNSFSTPSSSIFRLPNPPQQVSTVRAICPVPNSCTFCIADALKKVETTPFSVPVKVEFPIGGYISSPPKFRSLGETTFLDDHQNESYISYLRDRCSYLPRGTRSRAPVDRKGGVGLDIWLKKKRQERHANLKSSRAKVGKVQKVLKRLQNHRFMHTWKLEKRRSFEERESIRQSKLDVLRRKGIKAREKTECPLWNCPRKEYRRKRPFMPLDSLSRSSSRLSDLSKKSRSPIVFRRAR